MSRAVQGGIAWFAIAAAVTVIALPLLLFGLGTVFGVAFSLLDQLQLAVLGYSG